LDIVWIWIEKFQASQNQLISFCEVIMQVVYVHHLGDDYNEMHRSPDDDPLFSEVLDLIDIIKGIDKDPETAQILSPYEGMLCSSTLKNQIH
jgi:hypothetical protein